MIEYVERDGSLRFAVQVVPRASRSEIVGEHGVFLKVRLGAAPVEGAANDELVRLLSDAFGVPKSAVKIINGLKSKRKEVLIVGATAIALRNLLSRFDS